MHVPVHPLLSLRVACFQEERRKKKKSPLILTGDRLVRQREGEVAED